MTISAPDVDQTWDGVVCGPGFMRISMGSQCLLNCVQERAVYYCSCNKPTLDLKQRTEMLTYVSKEK